MTRRKKHAVALPPPWAPWSNWVLRLDEVYRHDGKFIEPLSERWRQARRGRLTASQNAIVIAERRPATWNRLMDQLDRELTPDWQREERNVPAMNWGRKYESAAIANIMLIDGDDLTDPGLLFHEKYPFVAATPDAMIDGRISVQIKCPYNSDNHLALLYNGIGALKSLYAAQVQWELWVSKAESIRFYSYDPRQPAAAQLARIDILADKETLDKFDTNVRDFATLFNEGKRLNEGKTRLASVPALF